MQRHTLVPFRWSDDLKRCPICLLPFELLNRDQMNDLVCRTLLPRCVRQTFSEAEVWKLWQKLKMHWLTIGFAVHLLRPVHNPNFSIMCPAACGNSQGGNSQHTPLSLREALCPRHTTGVSGKMMSCDVMFQRFLGMKQTLNILSGEQPRFPANKHDVVV